MNPTPHDDINALLNELLQRIQSILGEKLVGFYLYGSLVWGDFDYETSDIDLLAVTSTDINKKEFDELKKMHEEFVKKHPAWDDRIEVQYYAVSGLQSFKMQKTKLAVISPGDPLHIVDAGIDWLMNWYFVQEYGVTLFGPKPSTILPYISKGEFLQRVKDDAVSWREYVKRTKKSRSYQAYAILTMCRALYTYTYSKQVSKKQAAKWAQKELPEWLSLIQNALVWRNARVKKHPNNEATYKETVKLVSAVIDRMSK